MTFLEDETLKLLALHEGYRQFPYRCTADKLTIGYGFNLDDVGLSVEESKAVLKMRVEKARAFLTETLSWFRGLNSARQAVLVDMYFNLGWPRLSRFRNTLAALEREDWEDAAHEMMDSKWAEQVGRRARRLSQMMLSGEWPDDVPSLM
jgi:lysozyme